MKQLGPVGGHVAENFVCRSTNAGLSASMLVSEKSNFQKKVTYFLRVQFIRCTDHCKLFMDVIDMHVTQVYYGRTHPEPRLF